MNTPIGFVATCQCNVKVGAMDFERTDKKDAGKIISKWLLAGCTIEPRFTHNWSEVISNCKCKKAETYLSDDLNY